MERLKKFWHDYAGMLTLAQTAVGATITAVGIWSVILTGNFMLAGIMITWSIFAITLQLYSGYTTAVAA